MTYREAYEAGKGALRAAGIEEADLDARLLLEFVCGTDRNTLLAHGDRSLSEAEADAYQDLCQKRSGRIPLQHLTGMQNFMGLDFIVNEHVLIPRQDTEILVEEALSELHDGMEVLDMCTGSGCILISLLHYSNDCTGVGVDISAEALKIAEQNGERLLGEKGTPAAIRFLQSDLFENLEGQFDMIVSNPPYIRSEVIGTLMPEVKDHEPRQALDGREDGLFFYRQIIEGSVRFLKGGGQLLFEIGFDQGEAVKSLMEQAGYLEVRVIKDYAGLDRVVSGCLSFAARNR
jgi:release factor glutamine methyltransferase